MRSIISGSFQTPEIRLEGLFTSRLVALCEVRLLVSGERREVLRTVGDGSADGREALTSCQFVTADRSAAGDRTQTAEVDARTLLAGRFGLAVGGKNHLLVLCVRGFLVDFGECTADGLDRVSIRY